MTPEPAAIMPPEVSCAQSQNLIPAAGNRSEIGIIADPIMPNALSMPCICRTLMNASSVVIFIRCLQLLIVLRCDLNLVSEVFVPQVVIRIQHALP